LDENELLARLKSRIGPDLAPVRPLPSPGSQALWLLLVWMTLGTGVLLLLGLRPDFGTLGTWPSIGFSLIEIAVCFWLVHLSLRSSIPAMSGSLGIAIAGIATASCVHLLLSWATLDRNDLSPAQGEELRDGLRCFTAIVALALGPLMLGGVLLLRGLLTRYLVPFALTGFASGLAGEATWRLHCPYSAWDHVLPSHTGALALVVLVATGVALLVRRRARAASA
jgi:hypothetical protein